MKLLIIIELIVISFRSINMSIINKFIKFTKLFKSKIWRIGILNNIAANIELENLVKNLDFNTVLDIGSNKGQFILLIENFYKDIIIHSFEPIKELIEKKKIFFKFKKNIFFYNIGVGKKSTKKNFFITKRKDSSSFLKADNIKIKDYNIAEEREINIKSLTFKTAKKANNATYSRRIALTGSGSTANVLDEANFLKSNFPKNKI
mgnify:CR=1 FL=1